MKTPGVTPDLWRGIAWAFALEVVVVLFALLIMKAVAR